MEIRNDFLSITASESGATLTSIVNLRNGCEYLWTGDSAYWTGQAPILFPIVGCLKNGRYTYDGQSFELPRHGFARRSLFEVIPSSGDSLSFRLVSDQKTKAVYPFDFLLTVTYRLVDNTVQNIFNVENTGDTPLPFSLGGHPGFNCPLFNGEAFLDYYLQLEQPETLTSLTVHESGLISSDNPRVVFDNCDLLPLTHSLFDADALVFEHIRSKTISLRSKKNDSYVTVGVDSEQWPYLGIWSAAGDAPFVCIEPWTGMADAPDADGMLLSKKNIITLAPQESYTNQFDIQIG